MKLAPNRPSRQLHLHPTICFFISVPVGKTFSTTFSPVANVHVLYGIASTRVTMTDLEELDERRRMAAQYIEAIERRRQIIFDKRHKKRALRPGMMVMIQDARKLEFPGKFHAVWLGPYVVREVFPNNSLQLETLNGESFSTRTSGSRCKEYRA